MELLKGAEVSAKMKEQAAQMMNMPDPEHSIFIAAWQQGRLHSCF